MDPQIEDEQMRRRNELNYIVAMITKYFSKVIVRFNPFGKEGMYFFFALLFVLLTFGHHDLKIWLN